MTDKSIDQQAKELPELPEPDVPEGDWFERDCYIKSYAQAYGAACVAQAREQALEEEPIAWLEYSHGTRYLHFASDKPYCAGTSRAIPLYGTPLSK